MRRLSPYASRFTTNHTYIWENLRPKGVSPIIGICSNSWWWMWGYRAICLCTPNGMQLQRYGKRLKEWHLWGESFKKNGESIGRKEPNPYICKVEAKSIWAYVTPESMVSGCTAEDIDWRCCSRPDGRGVCVWDTRDAHAEDGVGIYFMLAVRTAYGGHRFAALKEQPSNHMIWNDLFTFAFCFASWARCAMPKSTKGRLTQRPTRR